MPAVLPPTVYDSSVNYHWMNANDREMYQRAFQQSDAVNQRICQAMIVANPATPNAEIMQNMNVPKMPARQGYENVSPTINDVFNNELPGNPGHINDQAWNDFSGSNANYEGTSVPSLPIW